MAITGYQLSRVGDTVTVTVTSDLGSGVRYYWYYEGAYIGQTTGRSRIFRVEPGEQARIEVLDSTASDFDPIANAPTGWPARRTIWWTRSTDASATAYLVKQQKAGGDWTEVARVPAVAGVWAYYWITDRLDDLTEYNWSVAPVDAAGNVGTGAAVQEVGADTIVRRPDAPAAAVTYDSGTNRVTFSSA